MEIMKRIKKENILGVGDILVRYDSHYYFLASGDSSKYADYWPHKILQEDINIAKLKKPKNSQDSKEEKKPLTDVLSVIPVSEDEPSLNWLTKLDTFFSFNLDESTTIDWAPTLILATLGLVTVGGIGFWIYKRNDETNKDQSTLSTEAIQTPSDTLINNQDGHEIKGQVVLGPIIENNGLVVKVLSPGGGIGQISLNANGSFSVILDNKPSLVKIVVEDKNNEPDYIDEASGLPKNLAGELSAFVTLDDTQFTQVSVNPLTHISALLIEKTFSGFTQDLSSDDAVKINTQVAQQFLNKDVDITRYVIEPVINLIEIRSTKSEMAP